MFKAERDHYGLRLSFGGRRLALSVRGQSKEKYHKRTIRAPYSVFISKILSALLDCQKNFLSSFDAHEYGLLGCS